MSLLLQQYYAMVYGGSSVRCAPRTHLMTVANEPLQNGNRTRKIAHSSAVGVYRMLLVQTLTEAERDEPTNDDYRRCVGFHLAKKQITM